jgi:hypothetical protein
MWKSYLNEATRAARADALKISIIWRRNTIVSPALLSSTAFDIGTASLEITYEGGKFVICDVIAVGQRGSEGGARSVKVNDALDEEFLLEVTESEKLSNDRGADIVAEAGEDSFPASDPPAWSGSTVI